MKTPKTLFVAAVCLLLSVGVARDDYYDYISEPIDEYGNVIGHDRMSELAAMRSTNLGHGINDDQDFDTMDLDSLVRFPSSPFGPNGLNFMHRIFKRQAPGFGPIPKSDFGGNPFQNDPFDNGFDAIENKLNFFKDGDVGSEPRKRRRINCNDKPVQCDRRAPYRNYDGHCNNLQHPTWGATMQPVVRMLPPAYTDGHSLPRMYSRVKDERGNYPLLPSPRYISLHMLFPDDGEDKHLPDVSNIFMQWGQFTDHDMTGTPVSKDANDKDLKCCKNVQLTEESQHHPDVFQGKACFPIYIPPGDRHFHGSCMEFARSQPEPKKLVCEGGYREQMNMLTPFIDSSQVYGVSFKDTQKLRLYSHGMMRVTDKNLLPEDHNATCIRETSDDYCFLAGDERVNEQPALSAMHTALHRYHNLLALTMQRYNPHWTDEKIYRECRKITGALAQHITYFEWLPMLLGPNYMEQYGLTVSGPDYTPYSSKAWYYDPAMNPSIMNPFSSAAMRFGHTLIPSRFSMGGRRMQLRELFNRPQFVTRDEGNGLNVIFAGLTTDPLQHFDHFIASDLTDHLFEDFKNKSLDLPSLNIQRGRDHGLPPYNDYRKACGLAAIEDYRTLKTNFPSKARLLSNAYRNIDDIDLFPGGISENPVAGAMIGPTFACIVAEQFRRIKFGDRFWHESSEPTGFSLAKLREIKKITLARIMCDVTSRTRTQRNIFLQPSYLNPEIPCQDIPDLDYSKWRE